MTRIRYIAGPGRIAGASAADQAELDAYVATDQGNFYGMALAYAKANTSEQLGLYGGLPMTADQFATAAAIKAQASEGLLQVYARQTELAAMPEVEASWGIDPALESFVATGELGGAIGRHAGGHGLILAGPTIGVIPVPALVVVGAGFLLGVTVTAIVVSTIQRLRSDAEVSVEKTDELLELAAMLPSDAERERLFAEMERQVDAAYRQGRGPLFGGLGTSILSAGALAAGAWLLVTQLSKPKA